MCCWPLPAQSFSGPSPDAQWFLVAASGLILYSRGTDKAENTVVLLRRADHTVNTGHVIAKHCWDVTSLHLRGNVFTEPLHNPVVPLLRVCIT
jgi:hypothetical protein